jgi:predicted RNase H-like HicB family nuclease
MKDLSYEVVVSPLSEEDGGGFLAMVPDLPGCVSDGETEADAIQNARDAILSWIDYAERNGQAVPPPTRSRIFAA